MKNIPITIKGTAFYAHVHKPNQQSGKFSIDLAVDAETSMQLKSLGLTPAMTKAGTKKDHDGTGRDIFIAKRANVTQSGISLGAPKVVDSQLNDTSELIGNGSTVMVDAAVGTHPKGVSLYLNAVQVIDLVPFEAKQSLNLSPVEGGFVASDEDSAASKKEGGDVI